VNHDFVQLAEAALAWPAVGGRPQGIAWAWEGPLA